MEKEGSLKDTTGRTSSSRKWKSITKKNLVLLASKNI